MHNKLNMGFLRSPDTGEGGGTATISPSEVFTDPTPIDSPAQGAGQESHSTHEPAPAREAAPAQQASSSVTMSEDQLAALAAKMVGAIPQQQVQAQPQQQTWTPEQQSEFDRTFNVVRVTPETFQAIMGFAPENAAQVKALETLMHNVVKQANAMTSYQIRQEMQHRENAMRERLSPVENFYLQQQHTALENEFFAAAPDLKDFAPLVIEVLSAAKANGVRFETKAKAIEYAATRVRGYLSKASPGGQTTSRQGSQTVKKAMPTTSMGGRTGSQNGSQPQPSGPQSVFGDLDA